MIKSNLWIINISPPERVAQPNMPLPAMPEALFIASEHAPTRHVIVNALKAAGRDETYDQLVQVSRGSSPIFAVEWLLPKVEAD